jgi:hypothetical protein
VSGSLKQQVKGIVMDQARNALVETAAKMYREHQPSSDGRCSVPGCAPDTDPDARGVVECLPYRMADAVLSMWAEPATEHQDRTPMVRILAPELAALRETADRDETGAPVTYSGDDGTHPHWCGVAGRHSAACRTGWGT